MNKLDKKSKELNEVKVFINSTALRKGEAGNQNQEHNAKKEGYSINKRIKGNCINSHSFPHAYIIKKMCV